MSRQDVPLDILPRHSLEAPSTPNIGQYDPYAVKTKYDDDQESAASVARSENYSAWKSVYFGISGMLGFGEKFSLLFCKYWTF